MQRNAIICIEGALGPQNCEQHHIPVKLDGVFKIITNLFLGILEPPTFPSVGKHSNLTQIMKPFILEIY